MRTPSNYILNNKAFKWNVHFFTFLRHPYNFFQIQTLSMRWYWKFILIVDFTYLIMVDTISGLQSLISFSILEYWWYRCYTALTLPIVYTTVYQSIITAVVIIGGGLGRSARRRTQIDQSPIIYYLARHYLKKKK